MILHNDPIQFLQNVWLLVRIHLTMFLIQQTLCWHLVLEHVGDWVMSCVKLGIKITADMVTKEVTHFQGESEQSECDAHKKPEHRNYSHEAFVDVISAWVVTDDQVHSHLSWIIHICLFSLPVHQCDRVSRVTTNIFNALQGAKIFWYSSSYHTLELDCRSCWRAYSATWERNECRFSKQIFTVDQSNIIRIGRPHSH